MSVHAARWAILHAIDVTGSGSGGGQVSSQTHSPTPQPAEAASLRRTDQQGVVGSQKQSSSPTSSSSHRTLENALVIDASSNSFARATTEVSSTAIAAASGRSR